MKLTKLEETLLAAARNHPPGDQVPYAFEKRIMANLRTAPAVSQWTLLGRALWRAAVPCLIITILCGIWTLGNTTNEPENLAQEFEHTVYAGINSHTEDIW
jgi:hypothetical protein